MVVAIFKELEKTEKRVAVTPEGVVKLTSMGLKVMVESGAGVASSYMDETYVEAGAIIEKDKTSLLKQCDILLAVQTPEQAVLDQLKPGTVLIAFLWPIQNGDLVEFLKKKRSLRWQWIPFPESAGHNPWMHSPQWPILPVIKLPYWDPINWTNICL